MAVLSIEISPDLGRNNPPSKCNKVVFPTPELPVTKSVSPSLQRISGKENSVDFPYENVIFFVLITLNQLSCERY
ncbi:hypothetical protein FCR2A7T_12050 [Flavobacterium cauense R2A-7]|nr:hypothetical protein FCR2A7T_12050 [Flavobacterium cauense R2A-7]